MSENNLAIRVNGVSKSYRLGTIGGRTLQEDLQSWWANRRGKEDPNTKVGGNSVKKGQTFWALDDINIEIKRGERVGIIGNNGAGKSTLLKLLSRITAPTKGDIDIWGRISSLLEIGTGFHREMTGRENIYMNGAILGMSRAEIDAKLDQIIEFSQVEEFIDTPVKRYSSGMMVKLAFSVAAHLDSEILVMDEVLAVGDMAFQTKCLDRMRKAADEEGRTVLYVSHNMDTIRRLCDRCIVLDRGQVIYDGQVEEAIARYMDNNASDNPVDIDLRNRATDKITELEMTRVILEGKASPVFEPGEDLNLQLVMGVNKAYEKLSLRVTLRNINDVGVGTAYSEEFDIAGEGEYQVAFRMPLDQLEKGVFYASIGVYQTDEIGRKLSLCHVTRAFRIEVQGLPIWDVKAHGYVGFSDIKLMEVRRIGGQ